MLEKDSDPDEQVFNDQTTFIREWFNATVGVIIALYAKDVDDGNLNETCVKIRDDIIESVLGNRADSKRIVVYDDETLKGLYKRIVEATLRWANDQINDHGNTNTSC